MELEVLKNEDDFLEFIVKGERHTFPNLLKSKLLEDKSVVFVSYVLKHPFDDDSVFSLRTSGKKPKKALEEALKEIEVDLDDFSKGVKKALK
mgnify:FL=1